MNHEQCACKQLKSVMFGLKPDQTDGLLSIALNNAQTLHGTPEHPGGLVKQVQEIEELAVSKAVEEAAKAITLAKEVQEMADKRLKALERIFWIATGFLSAVQIGFGIYIALKK